jgi:predicted permease
VILSLALGIGANTAIFSLMRAVMLNVLPVRDPQQLVLLDWRGQTWPKGLNQSSGGGLNLPSSMVGSRSLAYPFFRELRGEPGIFESVFAFAPLGIGRQSITLAASGAAERVDGEMVSGDYFSGLGVTAAAGRLITVDDERGGAQVAVISYAYWMHRFGGEPAIAGRAITIDGLPFTIAGVTAKTFSGVEPGRAPDVYVPMLERPELSAWGYRPAEGGLLENRGYWWTQVMARLKPGVDARAAEMKSDALFQSFVADALPAVDRSKPPHIGVEDGGGGLDRLRASYDQPLRLLMAMVALVLLIACANVAVLLLARSMARSRELALRLSLGASRARLIRQLLTESLLLACCGGALGVLFAGWTSRALLLMIPADSRPLLDLSLDPRTFAFAAAVAVGCALLFGLAPAVVSTRVDLLPAIKQAGSGAVASENRGQRLWSTTFVIAQMSLSLVLLVGAALFVRTLVNLQRQALGVDDHHVLVFGIDASQNGYEGGRLVTMYEDLIRRMRALPGVEAASAARLRLFSGWVSNGSIRAEGAEPKAGSMNLNTNAVAPDFVATTGMRLLAGRDISWADMDAKRKVAVMTESAAKYFFGEVNVVGRRYSSGSRFDSASAYEIVGVVTDAKYSQVRGPFPRTAYIPFTAMPNLLHGLYFHVRTSADPLAVAQSVRSAVHDIDPSVAIVEMDSMANQVAQSLWQERLFARLTSTFGALALLLASIGLYGTMSYGVGRRRSEIAVRMALGARYEQVLWMVLRQALALAFAGIAIGVPLALWAGRFLASQLFDLSPRDPATLAFTAVLLITIASLAGYLPARRAALVDPARALKAD